MWAKYKNLIENVMIIPVLTTYYVFDQKVFSVRDSQGKSMQPTISEHSVLFIDKLFYRWSGIKKNDIVVALQPVDPQTNICKRVVEVGGKTYKGIWIPYGHYWLQGDNKPGSYDSRHHGTVPQYLIQGKVLFSVSV